MTEGRSNGRRRGPTSATRRGFLALAGAASLAGCNEFGLSSEDEPPKIDGEAFADALSADPPTVAETLPVDVEQSHLDASADHARDLLSSVPAPFDDEEIPNGAIRDELSRRYEDASAELDDARDAPTDAETMVRLRDARGNARGVAAGWEAIDDGLTRADVLDTVPDLRDDIDAFRHQWRYVGSEPVRTVLAHGQVEELVAYAVGRSRGAAERSRAMPEDPTTVAELAGRIGEARAALDDAEYVFERYADSLDDPRDVRDGLQAAGEDLTATLDDRRASLPDGDPGDASSFVDRDIEGTPVAVALEDLYRGFEYADGIDEERATGRRASVVLSAHETLVRMEAFESLRERVANDEHVTVESSEDVRRIRERAFEAVEEAVESGDELTLRLVAAISGDFEYVEDELGGYADDDEVSVAWLDRELGLYVLIGAMARASPTTSSEVKSVLRERF
ncbi:serine/threonine-protein kinase [Halorussus litoreus]|uniref:hypothetical protein n=1 Tax=Halorussus litoreus TaxID=1710536 RepID=UPI000E23B619|nr:hypothetical protein [Halorussus litoreus]